MLASAVDHLIHNVLPAAADYAAAERELTAAFKADQDPSAWAKAARKAKRRAAELAIAVDGLTDRVHSELGVSKTSIRNDVAKLCYWPRSQNLRTGAHDRVRAVAITYKHQNLSDPRLPIASEADVLAVGLGYGLDGFGVGKYGGVEVLVRQRDGDIRKFLAMRQRPYPLGSNTLRQVARRCRRDRTPSAGSRSIRD